MPRPRIAMRKIRDVLRLTFGEGLSRRQVSASLGIPVTTVSDHVARAKMAGLSWPLSDDLDDAALERALFPPTAPSHTPRPQPDWSYVHTELRKKSVATMPLAWAERNSLQVGPSRRGAGPRLCRRRTVATLVFDTVTPSFLSSPTIRR